MKKEIVQALPAILIFALFCGVIAAVSTGEAVGLKDEWTVHVSRIGGPEDVWTVHVSLIEGPISWAHSVDTLWIAQGYVKSLEEDERYGGYWVIYKNGVEFDANRWHNHGR